MFPWSRGEGEMGGDLIIKRMVVRVSTDYYNNN